jgi:hypothetical protein
MRRILLPILGLGVATGLAACSASGPAGPSTDDFGYDGTGIQFNVAPLTLDTLSDACYSFQVNNEQGDLVVARGPQSAAGSSGNNTANSVCASRFGNTAGGDISYVAPCDAQLPPTETVLDGANTHTVTLWVDALCDNTQGDAAGWGPTGTQYQRGNGICAQIQNYVNPCGTNGCSLQVQCRENADTPVTFNFTIMGQADQGFFDIAVNFDDIFCSAKLDTCYGEEPTSPQIRMLFDPITGERIPTAVLALACTAGADAANGTWLHLGVVEVKCEGDTVATLDLSTVTQEGNQTPVNGIVWGAYFGSEALATNTGAPWNKEYFNVAVAGFGPGCSVGWTATASDGQTLNGDAAANTYTTYPVISFNDQVTAADGAWLCDQNGLDDPDSGVGTGYEPCSTPGECLGGPCTTTQGGVFVDCEAGPPVEPSACDEGGITVVLSGTTGEGDNQGTVSYTLFLPVTSTPTNGQPSFSQTLTLNDDTGDGDITFTAQFNGTQWTWTLSAAEGSEVQATAPSLTGPWTILEPGDGVDTMTVTCAGTANYACAEWIETEGPNAPFVASRDLFWTTWTSPSGSSAGWGAGGESGGIYHDTLGGNWQVGIPRDYNVDSGVQPPVDPWGIYTAYYDGSDPTHTGPESYLVEISSGPCDGIITPPQAPPTPHVWATYTAAPRHWRISTFGDVPPATNVSAVETTWQAGHERSFSTYGQARLDAMYSASADVLYVTNGNHVSESALRPFRVTTYANPGEPADVTRSEAVTANAWGVESGLTKEGRLYTANGFKRVGGDVWFLVAQPGALSGDPAVEGMHFYLIKQTGGSAPLQVFHAGAFIPDADGDGSTDPLEMAAEHAAMMSAWANVNPAEYRNFWFDGTTDTAYLSGPGFLQNQEPTASFIHVCDVETAPPSVSCNNDWVFVPSPVSFHGFYNPNAPVYTRAMNATESNPDAVRFGWIDLTSGGSTDTPGTQEQFVGGTPLAMSNRHYINFGSFNPANGWWVGMVASTTQFFAGELGQTPPVTTLNFQPAQSFNMPNKYEATATFHP